jgi:hypothetical protein
MLRQLPATLPRAAELASARSTIVGWAARGVALVRSLGPYAAIELLLPGGSVLALLLWLYRRRQRTLATRMASAKIMLTLEEQAP